MNGAVYNGFKFIYSYPFLFVCVFIFLFVYAAIVVSLYSRFSGDLRVEVKYAYILPFLQLYERHTLCICFELIYSDNIMYFLLITILT